MHLNTDRLTQMEILTYSLSAKHTVRMGLMGLESLSSSPLWPIINLYFTLMNQHRKACYCLLCLYTPSLHHTLPYDAWFPPLYLLLFPGRGAGREARGLDGVGQIVWGWCVCCVMCQYTASSVPGGVVASEPSGEKNKRFQVSDLCTKLLPNNRLFSFLNTFKVSSNTVVKYSHEDCVKIKGLF